MDPQQKELLSFPPPPGGSVFVSDRVSFRTEGTQRVISVQSVVFAHYSVRDQGAEAYAIGPQPFHGRTVILTNEHTHSAAEMVASFVRENRLAILVGATTAGEVLGGANFKLVGGYRLRMPVAAWYNWSGECIEGTGVPPDVPVEMDPESLASGIDNQLNKAIEIAQAL